MTPNQKKEKECETIAVEKQADGTYKEKTTPPQEHTHCWEGKNRHRCILCCKCKAKFLQPNQEHTEYIEGIGEYLIILNHLVEIYQLTMSSDFARGRALGDLLKHVFAEKKRMILKELKENAPLSYLETEKIINKNL